MKATDTSGGESVQDLELSDFTDLIESLNSNAIVTITDTLGSLVFVNEEFQKISGYSKSELIGQNHRIINSGIHSKSFFMELWKTISSGHTWHGEICNRKKNGELYWVETIISTTHDLKGNPYYLSIRFDITDRKLADLKLIESNQLWQFALEGAGDGVWDWNIPESTSFVSRQWKKMLGFEENDPENILEIWKNRLHPKDAHQVTDEIQAHFEGRGDFHSKHRIQCKDGTYKWILARGRVISRLPDGSPLRMVGTHTDIDDLMKTKEQLRLTETLNASILNSITAEISVIDPHGVIIAVNKPWLLFGIENSTVPGKPPPRTQVGTNYIDICKDTNTRSLEREDAIAVKNGIQAVLDKNLSVFQYEYPCNSPTKKRWFDLIVTPLGTDVHGAVISHFDISERKRAEAELQITEKQLIQSAKLASLGEMSAGIAHEINNPLSIIMASLDLLSRYSTSPEKMVSRIDSMKSACSRIHKIVRGLKKFSRSSEGAAFKNHSIAQIIRDSLALTAAYANDRDTDVSFDSSLSSMIFCDEGEITQIFINLISNAVDAVKSLDDRWIKIALSEEPDAISVKIIDSGLGIPAEIQSKLFDPFFTTKAVGEGTGLGLSITKGILDRHQATIQILNDRENTCFEIRFPRAKQE